MSSEPVSGGSGLIDRAKSILLTPRAAWDRIAAEPANTSSLFMGYLLPLAVLSAVCGVIGMVVFGVGGFGFTIRMGILPAIINGVVQVVMAVVGTFVMALIIDALAPSFGSTKNQDQAMKLAVYSSTAGLLAGVFMIYPPLAMLGIVAIYSFVLLYLGLPRLMKTPEDKRIGYFITIIIVCIVVGFIASAVMGAARVAAGGFGAPGMMFGQQGMHNQAQITAPDGSTISVPDLEQMGQAMVQGGGAAAADPAQLQAMLPASLPGGFARDSVSSASVMGMVTAEALYARGDANIRITLAQLGPMAGMAAMAGAAGVQQSQQDADGYTRTSTVNGRVIDESVSRSSNTANYSVLGRGVSVTADGYGVSIEDARAAVQSVNIERLEQAFGS